jgi:23S rRNA (adenine2503-C2)-methyltransferase
LREDRARDLLRVDAIAGTTIHQETAERLAALLAGLDAHVNLHSAQSDQRLRRAATQNEAATRFSQILQAAGFPATIRQRRGIDVAAGCGHCAL